MSNTISHRRSTLCTGFVVEPTRELTFDTKDPLPRCRRFTNSPRATPVERIKTGRRRARGFVNDGNYPQGRNWRGLPSLPSSCLDRHFQHWYFLLTVIGIGFQSRCHCSHYPIHPHVVSSKLHSGHVIVIGSFVPPGDSLTCFSSAPHSGQVLGTTIHASGFNSISYKSTPPGS
jgi:hypothetical protein